MTDDDDTRAILDEFGVPPGVPAPPPRLRFPEGSVRFRWLDADGNEVPRDYAGLTQPVIDVTDVPPTAVTFNWPAETSEAIRDALATADEYAALYSDSGPVVDPETGVYRRAIIRKDEAQ